jgi:hypothetical protein
MIQIKKDATKRPSRAAMLRLSAAKQGWSDAHNGKPPEIYEKMVMRPGGGVGYNPVPKAEQSAYIRGHMLGSEAGPHEKNPFGLSRGGLELLSRVGA